MRVLLLSMIAFAAACTQDVCDPDQHDDGHVCVTIVPDAAPRPDADGDAGVVNQAAGLGTACGSEEDCGESAGFCALAPGAAEGYCTPTGCAASPDLCPSGWHCKDLSKIKPELPSICERDA